MMPVGPLMIEHRVIEKMVEIMRKKSDQMANVGKADAGFVEKAVDFIRTYADRCHHGKEEDILFRELKKKKISQEHANMMAELEEDHRRGRRTTGELAEAKERYLKGEKEALSDITAAMKSLADLYPKHIEKEDKHFFFPVMEYFTDAEKQAMIEEEYEFDRKLIHEKYKEIVKGA